MLTIVGQLEVHGLGTTTLVVLDLDTTRVTRSGVSASRTIGHAVDDVQFGLLFRGNVEVGYREAALVCAARERGSRGARLPRAGDRGTALRNVTRDTFLGLLVSSVYAHETNVCVTYATLAKAGAKAISASETREGEATVFGERTRSKVRPAESLMLVVITLVGRSTRAGIAFLRAPVLCKAWVSMYIKDNRILA